MHEFIEFLGEPYFYANSALVFYKSKHKSGKNLLCVFLESLNDEQIIFLNRIMHAIEAGEVSIVDVHSDQDQVDLHICFGVNCNCLNKLLLPDLFEIQNNQVLKKQTWLTLKNVFYS